MTHTKCIKRCNFNDSTTVTRKCTFISESLWDGQFRRAPCVSQIQTHIVPLKALQRKWEREKYAVECICSLPPPPWIVRMFYNQIALQRVRMRYSFPAHSHTQTFSLIPLSPLWVCYMHFFSTDFMDNRVNHSRLLCREDAGASLSFAAQIRRWMC